MRKRLLSIGDVVVSVRDVEMTNRATVVDEENERGFVSVQFADGIRALPAQSVERVVDRKPRFRPESEDLAESTSLGDYISRIESGISQKEKRK